MTGTTLRVTTIAAVVGAGTVGGVYFAFSAFVMRALSRLESARAVAAMQAINRAAPSAGFMSAMFGTGALCVGLGIHAARTLGGPDSPALLVGALLYMVSIVVTAAYHVPRNHELARVDPHGDGIDAIWSTYAGRWTAWNHVRVVTSLAAAVALAVALSTG